MNNTNIKTRTDATIAPAVELVIVPVMRLGIFNPDPQPDRHKPARSRSHS